LVIELNDGSFIEIDTCHTVIDGSYSEDDLRRIGGDGDMDTMGMHHPVASIMMRRDG